MLKNILLILFLVPVFGFGQSFNLKTPNVPALKKQLELDSSKEIIFLYLEEEYIKLGNKNNIKKYEYNQKEICAFEQKFNFDINYTIDQCAEEGGMNYSISFPKVNRTSLMNWIQIMDKNNLSEVENSWNTAKTIYRPSDEGVGCYYTIKETETNSVVEIWCGC